MSSASIDPLLVGPAAHGGLALAASRWSDELELSEASGIVDRAALPDGTELVLHHRAGVFVVRAGGRELVSSRGHGSERALAAFGCAGLGRRRRPQVLIGGLGIGYTVRAALDVLPFDAEVMVAEVSTAMLRWHRRVLGALCGHPLADRRATVAVVDVARLLAVYEGRFDAILLDVDNGPAQPSMAGNLELYSAAGIAALRSALRPRGTLAVWSADPAEAFCERLERMGFAVRCHVVPAGRNVEHSVCVASLP